jgi:hypothetical protein
MITLLDGSERNLNRIMVDVISRIEGFTSSASAAGTIMSMAEGNYVPPDVTSPLPSLVEAPIQVLSEHHHTSPTPPS